MTEKNNDLILYFTTAVGISFWVLYLFQLRMVAPESSTGRVWWNNKRPFHGTLYLIFAYLYYTKNDSAFYVLFLDVLLGSFFWVSK